MTVPSARGAPGDPRLAWTAGSGGASDDVPLLLRRRDGILPAVAAALSVRGETLTCMGSKGEVPPELHPLVQDVLDTLTTEHRERRTGRCAETVLLSRFLTAVEAERPARRAARKPFTQNDARKALKHARLTARHIREDGDPRHGDYAPPCRSCAVLLAHFGVRSVDPAAEEGR
jgi:hypothetical protein